MNVKRKIKSWLKSNKKVRLILFLALLLLSWALLWWLVRWWTFMIVVLGGLDIVMFLSYRRDVAVPFLETMLAKEYLRVKAKSPQNRVWLGLLKYFLILFLNSQKSFALLIQAETPLALSFDAKKKTLIFDAKFGKSKKGAVAESFAFHQSIKKKVVAWSLGASSAATAVIILAALIFPSFNFLNAATFPWTQTDWSGGASSTAIAVHPGDKSGWTKYYSASSNLTLGASLTASTTASTTTDTTDADWQAGTMTNAYITGNSVVMFKPIGATCSGSNECVNGVCLLRGICGTYSTTTIATDTSLTSATDGAWVVQEYENLIVNSGKTLTVSNRNKGLILYIDNNLTVNGAITMTARGANAAGANICITPTNSTSTAVYTAGCSYSADTGDLQATYHIPAAGGGGGGAAYNYINGYYNGSNGAAGTNGGSGGGGSGGMRVLYANAYSGAGSAGTSYSGGSGGGGIEALSPQTSCTLSSGPADAGANGGAGGAGNSQYGIGGCYSASNGQGGVGNPGGVNNAGGSNASGTGGLLIIIVRGNTTIGAGGVISSNGTNASSGSCSSGGGASGGGSVNLLYKGSLTNSGSITATGGAHASCSGNGGNGGNGSVRTYRTN